jgi:hypothetical protein
MRTSAVALALFATMGAFALAQEEKKELPIPEGPPEQRTVVHGTPPADLAGRWLVVGWVELPRQQGARTTVAFWEITGAGEQTAIKVRFFPLPEAQQKAIDAANTATQQWRPSATDLAQVAATWDAAKETDPHLATIENEIWMHDAFDDDFRREPKTKDAIWAVRQKEDFRPSAAPAVRQINVYGALEAKEGGYAGSYASATLAAAPFPIPITLNGTFQSYRLDTSAPPPSPRGFLARLMDTFSGCGRR